MNGIKDDSEDSLVEQLYVSILHVLFMFAHGSLSLLLAVFGFMDASPDTHLRFLWHGSRA